MYRIFIIKFDGIITLIRGNQVQYGSKQKTDDNSQLGWTSYWVVKESSTLVFSFKSLKFWIIISFRFSFWF